VVVRVGAVPEGIPVPLVREPWIVETVRGIEVHAAGDGAAGHYELGARSQELRAGASMEATQAQERLLAPDSQLLAHTKTPTPKGPAQERNGGGKGY
jgi:hypothetical protein